MTGGPEDRPAFLDPKRAEALPYVSADEQPKFDEELIAENPDVPSRGIIDRYRELARLHAMGQTNNQICAILGYTPTRVSIILKDPFVQTEIGKWRQALFDSDVVTRIKDAAKDGVRRIHEIILDPGAKDTTVLAASQFVIEKTTGKPKQEVSVENGSLQNFIDLMREMRNRGEPLDVTPAIPIQGQSQLAGDSKQEKQETSAEWSSWISSNL